MSLVFRVYDQDHGIRAGNVILNGILTVPADARGMVILAHGSNSGRYSGRNRYLAAVLQSAGFATLLLDLLTSQEDDYDLKPDRMAYPVSVLATRLEAAVDWLATQPTLNQLSLGFLADGVGAAAALIVAARRPESVEAVVMRDGRPELAVHVLTALRSPTLLVIAANDPVTLAHSRPAFDRIAARKLLTVVPGATRHFEQPGTLEQVGRVAAGWFGYYLTPPFTFAGEPAQTPVHGAA